MFCVVFFLQVLLRTGQARVTAVTRGPAPIPSPGRAVPPGPVISMEGVMVSTGERVAVDAKEILLVSEGVVEGSGRAGGVYSCVICASLSTRSRGGVLMQCMIVVI